MTISRASAALMAAIGLAAILAGCQSTKLDVLTLTNAGDAAPPAVQEVTVPERAKYYLYSSKKPDAVKFAKEMRKGDKLGFQVRGNRVEATAAGTIIELEEYSEGASYVWKKEEKKE